MTAPSRKSAVGVVPAALIAMALLVPAAAAHPVDRAIVLPGATGTEGVARLNGQTFFAGDLLTGDIFRGTINKRTAAKFIDAPDGRFAAGMKADASDRLLFVAGGPTGAGYVYDTRTGDPVSSYQFQTPPTPTFINDVALSKDGAWFTDSSQALLYFVPVVDGVPSSTFMTLTLSGPAADLSGTFNNNGIQAVKGGTMLIVAHSGNGVLNLVDAATGASTTIAGVSVPNVDGILIKGSHEVFAVQNADNLISVWKLNSDFRSGTMRKSITSPLFEFPTTVARFGKRLAVANAKFDTGFPPTATQYEVVVVRR
jgi:WD40 repeat protein